MKVEEFLSLVVLHRPVKGLIFNPKNCISADRFYRQFGLVKRFQLNVVVSIMSADFSLLYKILEPLTFYLG
jgi:hypothetical protein